MDSAVRGYPPSGYMKRTSIAKVCQCALYSRASISSEIIVKSFKKCGIANAFDGSEDDILYEGSCEDKNSEVENSVTLYSSNQEEENVAAEYDLPDIDDWA